jgi:hypothetical protein
MLRPTLREIGVSPIFPVFEANWLPGVGDCRAGAKGLLCILTW